MQDNSQPKLTPEEIGRAFAQLRPTPTPRSVNEAADQLRAKAAWHMRVSDVLLGYEILAFDYPMSGNARPDLRKRVVK